MGTHASPLTSGYCPGAALQRGVWDLSQKEQTQERPPAGCQDRFGGAAPTPSLLALNPSVAPYCLQGGARPLSRGRVFHQHVAEPALQAPAPTFLPRRPRCCSGCQAFVFPRSECCILFPPSPLIPTFWMSAYPGASPSPPTLQSWGSYSSASSPASSGGVLVTVPSACTWGPGQGSSERASGRAGRQLINEGQRVGEGDRQVIEGVTAPCLSRHRSPLEGVTPVAGPADRPVRMLPREFLPRAGVRVTGACVKPETPSLTPARPPEPGLWVGAAGGLPGAWVSHTRRDNACANGPKGLSYPEALLWGPLHSWVSAKALFALPGACRAPALALHAWKDLLLVEGEPALRAPQRLTEGTPGREGRSLPWPESRERQERPSWDTRLVTPGRPRLLRPGLSSPSRGLSGPFELALSHKLVLSHKPSEEWGLTIY